MANESSTSTLDDITNVSLVGPFLLKALSERPGLYMLAKEFNLTGQWASPALKIATETSWWGSANDDGAGVDTEFDATQATDLSNTAVSSGGITITPGEYGVLIALTDNVQEDSVSAIDVLGWIQERMLHVISLAITDDYLALLAGFSNSVGTSGVDLTVAQLIAAQQGLRTRGVDADQLVYILDNQQVLDADTVAVSGVVEARAIALRLSAPARQVRARVVAEQRVVLGEAETRVGAEEQVEPQLVARRGPARAGRDVEGRIVRAVSLLSVKDGFEIGVIATPPRAAQDVADLLVAQ